MEEGFNEFFRQEHRRLVGFVMKLGAQQGTAEDVAQAAFMEAYRAWRGIRSPRAWVRKVATRTYLKNLDGPLVLDDAMDEVILADEHDFADHVVQRDRVLAALRLLPEGQRVVMAWTIDGYPPSTIARALSETRQRPVTPEGVRKNLQRARENLKSILGRPGKEEVTW